MELRHLRYFVAVADTRSFTAAAAQLHTAQPSLSRQIRHLEEHVGASLFDRSNRQVALTAAGLVFLDEARLTLAQADHATERVRQLVREQTERLSVGFDYGAESSYLAQLISGLRNTEHSPGLIIRSQPSPQLITSVADRQLDAAFVLLSSQVHDQRCHVLQRHRMVLAMPRWHRLATRERVHLSELDTHPLVVASSRHAPVLYEAALCCGMRHGMALNVAYEAESMTMALSMVSSIEAICLLPAYSIKTFPSDVVPVELVGDVPTVELALVWRPSNDAPLLRRLLQSFGIEINGDGTTYSSATHRSMHTLGCNGSDLI